MLFSVKTAYRLKHSSQLVPSSVTTGHSSNFFWKGMWNSKVPSSVKFNVWKLCHNILPTRDRLASKRVVLESHICLLCNTADESNVHLGSDYNFTREVLSTDLAFAQVFFITEAISKGMKEWFEYVLLVAIIEE